MAVIPDPADIGRNIESGQAAITRTPGLVPSGEMGPEQVAPELMKQLAERQLRTEIADAKTQFQLAKIEQDNAYDQDEDLDTIEERWQGNMTEQVGKAAVNITHGAVRNAFVQESMVALEQGRFAMRGKVHKRKSDREIAFAENATDALIKNAVSETGDIVGAFDAVEAKWNSLAEQGFTSNENAQQVIRDTKYKIAESKVQTLPPREQLEALKSDWAKELPLDVRVSLERAAKELIRIGDAQTSAFEARAQGLTGAAADTYFYEKHKNDPETLLEAQRQYSILENNTLKAEMENATDLYGKYDVDIRAGNITIDQIAANVPDEWKEMTPAMRTNLTRLQDNSVNKPPQYSNRQVLLDLTRFYNNEQIEEAKRVFYTRSSELNPSDYEDWANKVHRGVASSLFDFQKQVEDMTVSMGPKRKAGVYNSLTKWYLRYQEDNDGAMPPDREVNEFIQNSILNYSTGWFSSSLPSEMDPDDRFNAYRRKPPEEREDFLQFFENQEQNEVVFRYYREERPDAFRETMKYFMEQGVPVDQIDRKKFRFLMNGWLQQNKRPRIP